MYDPLALVVAIPALSAEMFEADELIVNGTAHRVIGLSKSRTGVKDGEKLKRWLCRAFLEGIGREHVVGAAAGAAAKIAKLRSEVAVLRAALRKHGIKAPRVPP